MGALEDDHKKFGMASWWLQRLGKRPLLPQNNTPGVWPHEGVSLNGGTPQTPQNDHF